MYMKHTCHVRLAATRARVHQCSLWRSCNQPKAGVTRKPVAYMMGNVVIRDEVAAP